MRNALILLAVVALIILAFGALNNGTTFEIDYVAGTVSAVSLFWVSAVIAALVFVAGLAATWFALAGAAGGRRKLEAELQKTYVRLREAEALAASRAPAPEPEPATVVAPAPEPATVVDVEDATAVPSEEATVAAEDVTVAAGEAVTAVDAEDVTAAAGAAEDAAAAGAEAPAEAGEQTAVTMAADAGAAEQGTAGEPLDEDAEVEGDDRPDPAEPGESATPDR